MTTITLPFPPSVNTYWRQFRGRAILSAKARLYRKQVHVCCGVQAIDKMDGRLTMLIELHPPDRRRRDVDNYSKGILDALCHAGVYDDDEQIDDLRVVRRAREDGGRAVVTVKMLDKEGAEACAK